MRRSVSFLARPSPRKVRSLPGSAAVPLLALGALLAAAPPVEAAGEGCTTSDACQGGIGLAINCNPPGTKKLTIAPVNCGGAGTFSRSLLRVAVRCFDAGAPDQARTGTGTVST
jgi:hypothetical protein